MNETAVENLVNTFQNTLYRYVRFLGADRETAREVVQDTFVAAIRSKTRPNPSAAQEMAPWLRRVARNLFLKACRSRRRLPVPVDPASLAEADACWTEWTRDTEVVSPLAKALRKCLGQLPDRQRTLLTARHEGRKARAEMAMMFDMTEDGIKSALRRIRHALAECIRGRLAEGTP